jgi:mono/diheme cytochrome c family protein
MLPTPALLVSLLAMFLLVACTPPPTPSAATPDIERGRYLVRISGCNDCHTEGFMDKGGDVPEQEWLKGSRRGWYNEQGTTYAANLRLLISRIDADQWVTLARTMRTKAPMAWYRLRELNDTDLRAMYSYMRWLGPAGTPAPPPLPAGVTPPEPYIYFPAIH